MTDYKDVQDEELEALRAIFEDDWHDIPAQKTAWGTEGEHGWWEVSLRATHDDRISVKLRGRFVKKYPDHVPLLTLVEPTKLNASHMRTLTKLVQDKAKSLVGAPMIFDIADTVREWITENHIPLPKPGEPEPTLMEEMAQREEAQRAAEIAQAEAERERKRAQALEQERLLKERIQLDATRKEERARKVQQAEEKRERDEQLSGLADGELEDRELVLDAPISIDGYVGSWSNWALFGGRREGLWTSYIAEPARSGRDFVKTGTPSVTVLIVDFSRQYYHTGPGKKRIEVMVTEMTRLKSVHSAHVAKVYAVHWCKSPKGWERLAIVIERIPDGGKLRAWLPKEGFGEETAKDYITQVLTGLSDLHRQHATQRQLDTDLILVSPGAGGDATLKLSGTSYARRIIEYHRSNPFLKSVEDNYPESWLSPEEIDSPYSYTGKRDVWYAGLILLQLLFGRNCLWIYPNLQTLLAHAPGGVSPFMMELLTGLLNPSHKRRFTVDDALTKLRSSEEETTRRPGRPIPLNNTANNNYSHSVTPSASQFDLLGKSPVFGKGLAQYFPTTPTGAHPSRYRQDFEEVEFLGKGGFGEVVKARNKLDGRPYAIKKIKLRPEDNVNRVLREVNSLSRVSHQYIVRYYSCWLEEVGPPEPQMFDDMTASTTTSSHVSSEEDIFAVNFDDLSVSRRDQSRSASFPRIRFTAGSSDSDDSDDDSNDDDDDDDDDDTDSDDSDGTIPDPSASGQRARGKSRSKAVSVPSRPSGSYTGTTTDDASFQRILYIQMEFVEKQTLREAITAGLAEDGCWRLLVQILQALAHMSSLGIVHRDLKPSNILLDTNGNVKIADFGLSTSDPTATDGIGVMPSSNDIDKTSNIGTSLYIAPEVLVSKSYNEKADMYSLGIIFFEMCFPFKTGMERVQTLTALRGPEVPFPTSWPVDRKPKQREIISLLLRHDPTMRPQAAQLLAGPLVPSPDKEQKLYDNVITEITNPRSEKYPELVDALFQSHKHQFNIDTRLDDFTYDNDHDDGHHIWLTVVIKRVVDLFQRHGAVDDYLPLLVPETTLLKAFPDLKPVRLLDQNGKFVQLPWSNLLGMARSASRRQLERIKRYVVGRRYAELPAGGQPGTAVELCFDIVSPLRSSVAEAELLEVLDKMVTECQGTSGGAQFDYEFHVSHESVLATILADVPTQCRPRLLKAFRGSPASVSFEARSTLQNIPGLPKSLLADLQNISGAGEYEQVRRTVENSFTSSRRKLAAALDEINTIIKFARATGITRKILFRPTMAKHAEYFRGGFMFELVKRGKHGDVLAFGGRYDSLLEHFKEPARQSLKVYGAGMSIAVDNLTRTVRKQESLVSHRLMTKNREDERSFGLWSPARCDVYVATFPGVDIEARLALVGELWKAGIRADLQYDDGRSQDEVIEECKEQNILYLVIARARPTVKVIRTLGGRSEEEVAVSELSDYLRNAITEQRRIDSSYADGLPLNQKDVLSKTPVEAASKPDAEIKLVLPPEPLTSRPVKGKPVRKHRHVTKAVYYDKAADFAVNVKSSLPVIGVDLSAEMLSAMTLDTAWVRDDEAWRAITHPQLPTSERRYADQVRDAVREHSSATGGPVWLFSVREARGFLLQIK